ncbi:hypothetical protein FACS189429_1450 [Bacteroidia bacterium]|nr:hypothetical protein FACS189429_1450 [Bacteroidia bacterium]GHV43970.1 hypothetical protein FACS1894180_4590 [Bacteroidia bacterium]
MRYNFIYNKRKIIVEVTIKINNEIKKLNFIVDIGASTSVIDEDTARFLGFSADKLEKANYHTAGGRTSGKILKLPSFGIFNEVFYNCEIAIINLSPFVTFYCEGLIGNDILEKLKKLKIDCIEKTIEV